MNRSADLHQLDIRALNVHDTADAARIDAYVNDHAEGSLFHRSAWLRAVEVATGARAHMLAATDATGAIAEPASGRSR